MTVSRRVLSVGKLVMLAAALAATYVLFAVATMRLAMSAREVWVPNLRGRSVNEAAALLADVDLTLRVEEALRPDPGIPAGRVLAQEPAAGQTARRQRSIKVWLSAGPRAMTVPRLAGETDRTASVRLEQEGLLLQGIAEIRSGSYPANVVVGQEPAPSSRGNRVALLVNRGEGSATFIMPDLIGVNAAQAEALLRSRGFRVAVVASHPYPGVPPGIVLRQAPQGGFQIASGQPISLEVSR